MGQKLLHIFVAIGLSFLLAACSNAPEPPEFCTTGMTIAPKKATSRPYQIKGIWYYPQPHYEYDEVGIASYYGGTDVFHGRKTATGEVFDMNEVSAAHKTVPLPCVAIVTNLENGREIQVKINDRGPFVEKRIIDVSRRTAQLLGFDRKGTAKVRVRTLVSESLALHGIDPSTVLVAQKSSGPLPIDVSTQTGFSVTKLPDALFEQAFEEEVVQPLLASASAVPSISCQSRGIFVDVKKFNNQVEAEGILKSLRGKTSKPADVIQSTNRMSYVVRVGPFANMVEANQALDQLAKAGHVMSRITLQR